MEYQTINLLSHYIHRMDITQKFFKDVYVFLLYNEKLYFFCLHNIFLKIWHHFKLSSTESLDHLINCLFFGLWAFFYCRVFRSANFHLPGVRIAVKSWVRKKAKALKPSDADFHLIEHFKAYISYDKDVRFVKDFQVFLSQFFKI